MSDLFTRINTLENAADAATAAKHVPVITVPEGVAAGEPFDLTVSVGEVEHVSENAHFIQWIELYHGYLYVARVELIPVVMRPRVTFRVAFTQPGTLRAVERCNLHGLWEGTAELKL